MQNEDTSMLTTKQAAERLGVSESYLEKDRCYAKLIPYVKFGACVRYRLQDIDEFIQSHLQAAAQ